MKVTLFRAGHFSFSRKEKAERNLLKNTAEAPINQSVERAYLDIVAIEYRKSPLFFADTFLHSK